MTNSSWRRSGHSGAPPTSLSSALKSAPSPAVTSPLSVSTISRSFEVRTRRFAGDPSDNAAVSGEGNDESTPVHRPSLPQPAGNLDPRGGKSARLAPLLHRGYRRGHTHPPRARTPWVPA